MNESTHDTDAVHPYVAGRLDEQQMDAFEEHLLLCAECREAVRLGAVTRVALRGTPATIRAPYRMRSAVMAAAVMAAAAVFVVALAWTLRGDEDPLARVEAPVFREAAVRDANDSTTSLVDRGMRAYAAGNYARAAELLERASIADSTPGVAFYLGASLLLRGEAARALPALRRAREPAANPYASDATLLTAKALLRLGRNDSALALLDAGVTDQGGESAQLQALADSIRRR